MLRVTEKVEDAVSRSLMAGSLIPRRGYWIRHYLQLLRHFRQGQQWQYR
jgi:hypothetical protein